MSNPINISPINFHQGLFGGGKNDNIFTHYIFEIILFMKNGESIVIEEISNEKYINLFSYNNKINFNDIIWKIIFSILITKNTRHLSSL